MKSYREYYQFGLSEHLDWKSKQDEEWWKNKNDFKYLETKGDYIETVHFLTIDEKNDASLFFNATNVKNSEWGILFDMLGQALVDWCVENMNYEDLWSVDFKIDRFIEDGITYYIPKTTARKYNGENEDVYKITDETILEKLEDCTLELCKIVDTFISTHGKNIPNDWNYFSFGLDSLYESCKWGIWVCSSDGYMNLGNYNEETEKYDQFVECM